MSGGWGVQLNKRKRKEEKKEWDRLIKNETDTKGKQTVRLGARRRGNGALGDNISVFFFVRRILMNMDESADVTVTLLRINTPYFTVFTRLNTANIFSAALFPLLLHLLSFFLCQEKKALGVLFFYNQYAYCILELQSLWKVDLTKWLYFDSKFLLWKCNHCGHILHGSVLFVSVEFGLATHNHANNVLPL